MSETLDVETTNRLKDKIAELHEVKTHTHITRGGEGVYWHARSMGVPRMENRNPVSTPSRVRMIESWLKGGHRNIGRVNFILQYVFNGQSIFDLDDVSGLDYEIAVDGSGNINQLLKMDSSKSAITKDLIVSHKYKIKFASSGRMYGTVSRMISEPPIAGLEYAYDIDEDESEEFHDLTKGLELEFCHTELGVYEAGYLLSALGKFAILEKQLVLQRESSNIIYYDEEPYAFRR